MDKNNQPPKLPNTTKWQPNNKASDTLKTAFLNRCTGVEMLVRLRAQAEKSMNVDNFDSGLGVEDIIREELKRLLPNRYSVKAGLISDESGQSGGDFDVVIFNDFWFPVVKAGATPESRRIHIPIDGVYAVCEVKQTLDYHSFDAAMEKLVGCHRLNRQPTHAKRIVENCELNSCKHGLSNPLYSIIIATDLKDGLDLDDITNRFYDINKSLKRLEVIRALCVLGKGTVTWGWKDNNNEIKPARFMMEDLYCPIYPMYSKVPHVQSALYPLIADLLLHLYHSVLAPEDLALKFGPSIHNTALPASADIALHPDSEWLLSLSEPCDQSHN